MRPKTAAKYSLFLIFLTLGQEFNAAYRLSHPSSQYRWSEDPLRQPEFQSPHFSKPLSDDFQDFVDKRTAGNDTSVEVVGVNKRWGAAIGLAAGIGISLAGIGLEIYLKLEGCCGPYPKICDYIKDFKAVQKRLKPLFPKVDFAALTAKNTLEDITQTNYNLIEIWNDMKRIRDLKTKLLVKLSASTIKSFNNKWSEIEVHDKSTQPKGSFTLAIFAAPTFTAQLRSLNSTVRHLTYKQLSAEFQSYFGDYKKTLLAFTPIFANVLGLAAIPAYRAYKRYSLNKEIQRLSTGREYKQLVTARHGKAAKILGVTNINQHIRATATARNNARFSTGKYTNYVVKGIGVASALIGLGVEIYAAYQKFSHCKDTVMTNVKKGRDDIIAGEKQLLGTYKNVTDYISLIDEKGVKYLKNQLAGQRVRSELELILKLAKGVGKKAKSKNMTIAAASIDAFIVGIREANANKTQHLSAKLADGLARIKFLYTCYVAKVSLVDYCAEQCKNGTGTLANIFAAGVKHFDTQATECRDDVGVPYYGLSDMQFTLNKKAPKENFSADCTLNSKSKGEKACRLWDVDRKEKPEIEKEMGLSTDQVNYFLARCKPHVLTEPNKRTICFARSFGATDQAILDRKILPRSVTLAQVKAVTCPRP